MQLLNLVFSPAGQPWTTTTHAALPAARPACALVPQRELVAQMQQEAAHSWWQQGHTGWAIFPVDTDHFLQVGCSSAALASRFCFCYKCAKRCSSSHCCSPHLFLQSLNPACPALPLPETGSSQSNPTTN